MVASVVPPADPSQSTAIDSVFDKLLQQIMQGHYAAGSRLPAERDLSKQLGASRPTLREALRRLGEWNLVEPRRGSGVVVKSYRDWSIEVVPAYLRYGKPGPNQPSVSKIVTDLFALRRALLGEVLRTTVGRIPPGNTHAGRAAMARAWAAREDWPRFAREDFELMRCVVESASYTPGVWLLNRLSQIWLDLADSIRFILRVPADYVEIHATFFDQIDAGQPEKALITLTDYLERHDSAVTSLLERLQ